MRFVVHGESDLHPPLTGRNTLDARFDGGIDQCLLDGIIRVLVDSDKGKHGMDPFEGLDKTLSIQKIHLDPGSPFYEVVWGSILTNMSEE